MLFGPKLIKICDKSIIIHYKFQFNKFLKISDNYTISADERCIFFINPFNRLLSNRL